VLAALLVFVVVRWRGRFAYWEFAVIWLLVGAAMLIGILQARTIRRFGFHLTAQLPQQTALLLGNLALPAALVAGASVAEITVRATVAGTRVPRGWPGAADPRLLVLTNFVLTMTVLGYAALIRDGSTTIYLDPYAQRGRAKRAPLGEPRRTRRGIRAPGASGQGIGVSGPPGCRRPMIQ
jgi:hypothetical protein